ncbi:MAG: uroporphyrinogen decarboxylase family protein [Anaerolineae bacterium]|nr:uroporphyrinogen decarboxylase family protein [Anaerolineae bacterium]
MNSKERVRRALAHEPVDRVPIGFFAIDFDTVERILGHETYVRAKAKSQIAFWEGRRDEVVQSWKEDTIELYRKLDFIDIVNVSAMASSVGPPKDYEPENVRKVNDNTWEADDGRMWKVSDITADLTLIAQPEPHYTLEDFPLDADPVRPDPSIFEATDAIIEALGDDHYILGPNGGEAGMILLGGMEHGLMMYALQPEIVQRAIAASTRMANLTDDFMIRPGTDGVLWGTDFAATMGPFISPRMFRKFCLPSIKERVQAVKSCGLAVLKHACGNNWKLLDMFLEAGYDAYQSIQTSASMDLADVKAKVSGRMALWGGAPVENLVSGTPDNVRQDVAHAMHVGAPGSGYIFGTTHSVAVGTKYDNFQAMLDAYLEWSERLASG